MKVILTGSAQGIGLGILELFLSEGHEANGDKFEMLGGKGQPHDRNGQEEAKQEVHQCNVKTSEDQPKNIEQGRQASGRGRSGNDLLTKGPKLQIGQLETLDPEGDTDDGATEDEASEQISQCGKKSAEYHPDEVAEQVHGAVKDRTFGPCSITWMD